MNSFNSTRVVAYPQLAPLTFTGRNAEVARRASLASVGVDDPRYPAVFKQVAIDRLRGGLRWRPAISQRSPFRTAIRVSLNQPLDSSKTVDSQRRSSSAQDRTSSRICWLREVGKSSFFIAPSDLQAWCQRPTPPAAPVSAEGGVVLATFWNRATPAQGASPLDTLPRCSALSWGWWCGSSVLAQRLL